MKSVRKSVFMLFGAMWIAGSFLLFTACAVPPPPGTVFVPSAPPFAEVEVVGTAPGPDFVWIHGYHRWDGGHYVWTQGRWERRPQANARWVDGHWAHHSKGYYWVEGGWR
jgi:WXXGXW repeat (2 copies)